MTTRSVGPFRVSPIGLGCMNLSHAYGAPATPEYGTALLNRALDLGCSFLDTAAMYGQGENERLIGSAVMRRRSEFTLASKCVLDIVDGKRTLDGRPQSIKTTCERALQRLGTDVIDLYYMHRLDPEVPVEESVGALAELVAEGKIRAIGLSEMSAATIRRAHAVHPIAAVQSEYSPAVRNLEVAVLETCRELDIAVVAFSPVARGLLAGAVRDENYAPGDIRLNMPRFRGENLAVNLVLFDRFAAIAHAAGITPAQLCLAWLLAQGEHVVPIPGTHNIAHLEENMAAASITLDADVLGQVDALLPPNAMSGARYARAMQAQVGTELLPGEELDAA